MKMFLVAALMAVGTGGGADVPRQPGEHSVLYREQVVIAADQARIWQLLVDLDGYQSWNPWVVKAEGAAESGADVRVQVVLNGRVMSARHTVLTVGYGSEFCWKDAGWNSWFVYGQRCRWLEPQPDGTVLFRQELMLDGPLSGVAAATMGKALQDGMAAETAALKRTAES
jgi:Polyketide cyclase / dehydrase and lipid transport